MRRRWAIALAVFAIAIVGFFLLAPGVAERSLNTIDGEPLIEVSEEARELHETL